MLLTDEDGPLRVFDSSGTFRGVVGRMGSAPDEYASATDVAATRDGRIYVFDRARFSVLSLGPAGQVLHRAQVPMVPDFWGTALWPGGIAILSLPVGSQVGQPVMGRLDLIPVDGDAGGTTTFSVPLKAVVAQVGGLQPMKPFFQARPIWAVAPDGAVTITTGDTPWIARYSRRGEAEDLIRLPLTPVPVTAVELQAEKERVLHMFTRDWWERTRPIIEQTAARSPRVHPLVTALVVLRDGSLWLRESPRAGADSVRWDVLAADGRLFGVVRLGLRDRVADGTSDRVLVVHDTASPEPYVSADRMQPATSGRP